MATTTQRSRFVAESCFDYLNLVMADTIFNASERSEVAVSKLETLGFRVGQKLIERYTVDRLRFNEKIDIIKFICREFWMTLFQKQVDSLRTNRKVGTLFSLIPFRACFLDTGQSNALSFLRQTKPTHTPPTFSHSDLLIPNLSSCSRFIVFWSLTTKPTQIHSDPQTFITSASNSIHKALDNHYSLSIFI